MEPESSGFHGVTVCEEFLLARLPDPQDLRELRRSANRPDQRVGLERRPGAVVLLDRLAEEWKRDVALTAVRELQGLRVSGLGVPEPRDRGGIRAGERRDFFGRPPLEARQQGPGILRDRADETPRLGELPLLEQEIDGLKRAPGGVSVQGHEVAGAVELPELLKDEGAGSPLVVLRIDSPGGIALAGGLLEKA